MKRISETEVLLARGWWTGDRWEQRVLLRTVDDCSEESLLEQVDGMLPVERDTTLLASCVLKTDGSALSPVEICKLSIGDRQTLLLRLRRLMLGNTMQCLLQCPFCAEKMDLQPKVDDLIVQSDADPQLHYQHFVDAGIERLCVKFHLPTGKDVEKAAAIARAVPGDASALLAQRCIESVTTVGCELDVPKEIEFRDWPNSLLSEVSAQIEQFDPQAEVKLQLVCPACGNRFEEFLDPGGYLVQELAARQRVKYQEVHHLARAYHWSEEEILRMGPRKRQVYLELLAAEE